MNNTCLVLATATLLGCASLSAGAQTASGPGTSEQIDALLAMAPADRRTYLKGLGRKERLGLWGQLKRTQKLRKGLAPKARGSGMQPHPLSAGQRHALSSERAANVSPLGAAVGTIVYDKDFPSVTFGNGSLVGNRFNTHTGIQIPTSGTLSTVQALVVPGTAATSNSAGFVVLGPQTSRTISCTR